MLTSILLTSQCICFIELSIIVQIVYFKNIRKTQLSLHVFVCVLFYYKKKEHIHPEVACIKFHELNIKREINNGKASA